MNKKTHNANRQLHSILQHNVLIYRDDQNHPTVSGNKLHKLSPNLELAINSGCHGVVSFGGPYSNHLHALAWACKSRTLASVGIIRGELHSKLTPTLKDCSQWGMSLVAMNRAKFRECQEWISQTNQAQPTATPIFSHQLLPNIFPQLPENFLIIPEGGSNQLAIQSLAQAYEPLFEQAEYAEVTHAVCATGTGATLAGLRLAAPKGVSVLGIQAVAEGDATLKRIHDWLGTSSLDSNESALSIIPGHLGGFAKTTTELLEFINDAETVYGVPLDPIYNAKVLFALENLACSGYFSSTDKILVIHTGGLQGNRGIAFK
ncbi:pyridoxal-phosphate dependent enzyme [Arenicella sp. 4NH20-0111]|uniref:1-aminocyclopropane-1-carboxylate deaminase/D-cysteine desulfhydrase n=1 Tax=Arenicella sp. 4NH20-0111 TaxID=3127648 RepID=UPI00310C2296